MHYMGVDAGTKTRFEVFDHNGTEVHRIETETIHFMTVGFEGINKKLSEI